MSRSYRRTPVIPNTTRDSDKRYKAAEHRRERQAVRVAVRAGKEPPHPKYYGNQWKSNKDGKQWIGDRYPHLLRK